MNHVIKGDLRCSKGIPGRYVFKEELDGVSPGEEECDAES